MDVEQLFPSKFFRCVDLNGKPRRVTVIVMDAMRARGRVHLHRFVTHNLKMSGYATKLMA